MLFCGTEDQGNVAVKRVKALWRHRRKPSPEHTKTIDRGSGYAVVIAYVRGFPVVGIALDVSGEVFTISIAERPGASSPVL